VSDIFETIKHGASQVFSELDQKGQLRSAFEGIRDRLSELERRRKVSALRDQISALQNEMKQLTEALGLQTLSLFDAGTLTHPELSRLCQRINELRSERDLRKAELDKLSASEPAQALNCPHCQAMVQPGADFCPNCGTRLRSQPLVRPAEQQTRPRTVVRLRCPRCKTILMPDAQSCPNCGVKIRRPQGETARERYCASCGAQLRARSQFCPICGQPAADAS
jgi:RNA polymerase subunit RPABC4/transcription elongation factor Spt4